MISANSIDNNAVDFSDFGARAYLDTYYSSVGSENRSLLEFYSTCYENVNEDSILLEFSGGPTIYSLIHACTRVREIHFSDFLNDNLFEVREWSSEKRNAHDWSAFFRTALEYERGAGKVTVAEVKMRERLLREKLTRFFKSDAFARYPILRSNQGKYDVINVNFVPESITQSKSEWKKMLKKIKMLLKPTGTIVITSITGASFYHIGEKIFPAVKVNERDILDEVYSMGASRKLTRYKSIPSEQFLHENEFDSGYTGMTFVEAVWT